MNFNVKNKSFFEPKMNSNVKNKSFFEPKMNFNVKNKSFFEPKMNFNVKNKSFFEPKMNFNVKNKSLFEPKMNFNVTPFEDEKVEEKSWYCRDCDSFHTSDKNKGCETLSNLHKQPFFNEPNENELEKERENEYKQHGFSSKWNELDKKIFGLYK